MQQRFFTEYGPGGFDPELPNNNIISQTPQPWTWDEIRAARAVLLATADIEINKAADAGDTQAEAEWRAYRVALRAIPQTFATPGDVIFPEPPL